MVGKLETKADFDKAIAENDLVVIDFTAVWCGPCRMIAPVLEELEGQYPDIKFFKVDVDENSDTAEACGISAMPTFHFYKSQVKEREMCGADQKKLKQMVQELKASK